jgi:hypothetical protein
LCRNQFTSRFYSSRPNPYEYLYIQQYILPTFLILSPYDWFDTHFE